MDRNQFIGILLIAGLLIVYMVYFAPQPPVEQEQAIEGTEETTAGNTSLKGESLPSLSEMNDSLRMAQAAMQYGAFSMAMQGEDQTFTLENKDLILSISAKGGEIISAELKEYDSYQGGQVNLLKRETNDLALLLPTQGGALDIRELYFTSSGIRETEGGFKQLILRAEMGGGKALTQTYTLPSEGFTLDWGIDFQGLQNDFRGETLNLVWDNTLDRFEDNLELSRQRSGLTYATTGRDFEELAPTSGTDEAEASTIAWAGHKHRFFTSALIFPSGLQSAKFKVDASEQSEDFVKKNRMEMQVSLAALDSADFTLYLGPNSYKVMKQVTDGFEQNVYLGYVLVSWVNKWIIINVFYFLEQYISNYGIIIMILVLIIKLALLPLSYKSYISMAKMKVLKPEMDELKEQVGDDMQKMQQEQMKLYQKVGVNPLSGCIPVVLQMPILFAMFFFFPNSIELRGESFLWAHDLSTYDVFFRLPFTIPFYGAHVSLFTLLMTASTILYTWSNNQVSSVTGPMKSIGYVMPLVFMFVLNSFPAGLSFYYFVSNIITFSQQAVIRKFVDDDKIRAILEENKKRNANKKKSKFQQRLEDAMRARDEQQKGKKPGTKK